MAIAKMEYLDFTCKVAHLNKVLQILQGFKGVQLEHNFESTISIKDKSALEKEIREIQKEIKEIQSASNVLKSREKKNLIESLNVAEKEYSFDEFTKIVSESNWQEILKQVIETDEWLTENRYRREELTRELEALQPWKKFHSNPADFKLLEKAHAVYGTVHLEHDGEFLDALDELRKLGCYSECTADDGELRTGYFLLYHNSIKFEVETVLSNFSFTIRNYPHKEHPLEVEKRLLQEEKDLIEKEKEISEQIAEQSKYHQILEFAEDFNLNLLLQKEEILKIAFKEDIFILNGWIVQNQKEKLLKTLKNNIDESDFNISFQVVRRQDINDVPIKLENNKLVSPFEMLTKMYSLPKYNELDPTPILAPFYVIFFGMCVGDLGYGFAIFLVTILLKKLFKLPKSLSSGVDFLFYLSFSIMLWGVVFGSLFGVDLPFSLINPIEDILNLIILSIAMGFVHVLVGFILNTYIKLKNKQPYLAFTEGLNWIFIFVGGLFIILSMTVLEVGAISFLGKLFLAVGLIMTVGVPMIKYGRKWYLGFFLGLYSLYGATSYFGDLISYTRLMTLGIAGASVATAFNTIIMFLPPIPRFTIGIVLAIGLHLLNLFLTLLSAYVHGLRLQFIEFFGKFYEGGGKEFVPFKAVEKHITITSNENK